MKSWPISIFTGCFTRPLLHDALLLGVMVFTSRQLPGNEKAANPPVDDAIEEVAVGAANEFSWLTEDNFNQWVFNPNGGVNGRGLATQARTRLTELAKSEIALVDQTCSLTQAQKQKLELAAKVDVSRVFDRVDAVREEMFRNKKAMNRANVNEFWVKVQKLQVEVGSIRFGSGSMFRKTLLKTLTPEQTTRYFAIERSRRQRRNRARVATAIVHLETLVPLEARQRKQLTELVENETVSAVEAGRYDTHLMLYRISKIPEAKLKPLLDAHQLTTLQEKLRQYQAVGQWLEKQGLLRDEMKEEDEAVKPQLSGGGF